VPPLHCDRRRGATGYRVVYSDERVAGRLPLLERDTLRDARSSGTHGPHLHRAATADLVSVGRAVRRRPRIAAGHLGDVPYNLVFHSGRSGTRAVPLAHPHHAEAHDASRIELGTECS